MSTIDGTAPRRTPGASPVRSTRARSTLRRASALRNGRGRPREIAVLGGGLAGLSLSLQLIARGIDARITIFEPRSFYEDDRTWCFWETEAHPFTDLIRERWWHWTIRTERGERRCSSARHPYARLRARDVYARALEQLRAAPNVALRTGVRVRDLEGTSVHTTAGRFDADLVFDGRPPTPGSRRRPGLLQQFVGRRVYLPEPVFDPRTCELMDFRVPQRAGVSFLYVLPSSPREALVEATVFSRCLLPRHALEALLDEALERRFGSVARELVPGGEEHGVIPMDPALGNATSPPKVIPIGTRAGAPRPSTGYAFLPIQRHSARLADALAAGVPSALPMRRAWTNWLDRIFLGRMRRSPAGAVEDFERMFDRVDADRLVRFLMERGSPLDQLSVMASLPKLPFLQEAARVAVARDGDEHVGDRLRPERRRTARP